VSDLTGLLEEKRLLALIALEPVLFLHLKHVVVLVK
jgi:hypothetical protein